MSPEYTSPKGKEVAHDPEQDVVNVVQKPPADTSKTQGLVPAQSPAPPAQPIAASATTTGDLEKEKDTDKDKGSLSTTVTGTRTHTRSSHRKGNKLPNKGTHQLALGSEKHLDNKKGQGQKPSLISKLVRLLIPCVGPSSRAHDQDVDKAASNVAVVEKAARVNGEPPAVNGRTTSTSGVVEQTIAEPSTSSTIISSTQNLVSPPQAPVVDPDVVIPPTPTMLLPQEETEGLMSGAVQPPGSKGEEHVHNRTHSQDSADESDATSTFTEDEDIDDINALDELEDEEDRLIMNGGVGIPIGPDGIPRPLLPPLAPQHAGRKCLVLDLDETLLHSSFKSIQHADYVVPVEIEYHWHNVYVIKRPGVDNFLKKMGELYEIVVFTASLSKYADPVLDKLDVHRVVSHRLFRESCYNHKGNYVKDLSQLGRPMTDTIILDNSPASYIFHPNNAVPVSSWFNDPHDTELTDLCPFLSDLRIVDDVRAVLDGGL